MSLLNKIKNYYHESKKQNLSSLLGYYEGIAIESEHVNKLIKKCSNINFKEYSETEWNSFKNKITARWVYRNDNIKKELKILLQNKIKQRDSGITSLMERILQDNDQAIYSKSFFKILKKQEMLYLEININKERNELLEIINSKQVVDKGTNIITKKQRL